MSEKLYAVVVLPKNSQSKTAEVHEELCCSSFTEAFCLLSDLVQTETGKKPFTPQTSGPYSVDTGYNVIQIWIIDKLPFYSL